MRPVYCYNNCLTIYSYRVIVVKHVDNAATISCRKFVVASEINALENAIDLVVVLHLSVAATIRATACRASAPSRSRIGATMLDGFEWKNRIIAILIPYAVARHADDMAMIDRHAATTLRRVGDRDHRPLPRRENISRFLLNLIRRYEHNNGSNISTADRISIPPRSA
jgi:hypothetical protein